MSSLTHVEIAIGGNARFSNHTSCPYTHTHTHTHTHTLVSNSKPVALTCCAEEPGSNGMMTNVCRVFNDKARAARAYARF